ncbi:hypothetical protein TVAG_205570 [Trichomonas vaginalis G3]|uniref:Uncharacterized protein n=1 Tax=Trichomonas vaginalis (strain ATCC PRA-98 / G3) TaxID=412133 RepID=A2FJE6_TRIV3|nr:hypothetical protein TVAGG3_0873280 [Trichomonas vaginalis G3]EAX94959.1 hypothetical protein TVAG_205570 [Trichomonas vaginalis G3]KAI5501511.1 hypothetical protein TVAGG3_0873280 [Trichomonas vaginalis G3]|eukprot:XP_001307889.1 hypothetical protein [Trichomonas vaginalis G3]
MLSHLTNRPFINEQIEIPDEFDFDTTEDKPEKPKYKPLHFDSQFPSNTQIDYIRNSKDLSSYDAKSFRASGSDKNPQLISKETLLSIYQSY